jgi:hypothetical protein
MERQKMKVYTVLPIIALFIIATIPGNKFGSLTYILKSVIALALLLITLVWYLIDLRKSKKVR